MSIAQLRTRSAPRSLALPAMLARASSSRRSLLDSALDPLLGRWRSLRCWLARRHRGAHCSTPRSIRSSVAGAPCDAGSRVVIAALTARLRARSAPRSLALPAMLARASSSRRSLRVGGGRRELRVDVAELRPRGQRAADEDELCRLGAV